MTGEVLGFYGTDRATAWGEAFRLGELLVKRGAAGRGGCRSRRASNEANGW